MESEISVFYSDDDRLKAVVVANNDHFYVDFYKDEVMLESRKIEGHTVRYAEDMAENFVKGIIKLDNKTWRIHGV